MTPVNNKRSTMAGNVQANATINGLPLGPVAELDLRQVVGGHHEFKVTCAIEGPAPTMETLQRDYRGRAITIWLTPAPAEGAPARAFEGVVTGAVLRRCPGPGTDAEVEFSGSSPTLLLDGQKNYRSFANETVASVIETILGQHPWLPTAIDVRYDEPVPYIVQYHETDFAFLNRLLATYGGWAYYDGRTAVFGRPPSGAPAELAYGRGLTSVEWDYRPAPERFTPPGAPPIGDGHPRTAGERAPQPDPGAVRLLITLRAESTRPDLAIGQIVTLRPHDGASDREGSFEGYGVYRITSLQHTLDRRGHYTNTLEAAPESLETPPITENQVRFPIVESDFATVTDTDDPEGLGRIRVRLGWQKRGDAPAPWLPVTTAPSGGTDVHSALPAVGQEVIVYYDRGNPDRPLYATNFPHGEDDAGDPGTHRQVIRMRSGRRVVLTDRGGETYVTIETDTEVITMRLAKDSTFEIDTTGDLRDLIAMIEVQGEEAAPTTDELPASNPSVSPDVVVDVDPPGFHPN